MQVFWGHYQATVIFHDLPYGLCMVPQTSLLKEHDPLRTNTQTCSELVGSA
jgi:hypothetical protein